jgi:hypothetical protein
MTHHQDRWENRQALKGVWHEIFDFSFFVINQCPPEPRVSHWDWEFFRKFAEIIERRVVFLLTILRDDWFISLRDGGCTQRNIAPHSHMYHSPLMAGQIWYFSILAGSRIEPCIGVRCFRLFVQVLQAITRKWNHNSNCFMIQNTTTGVSNLFQIAVTLKGKFVSLFCGEKCLPTRMRFELTRAEPNGLAVHRLNHSATLSC